MFDDLAADNVTKYNSLFGTPFLTADVPNVAELTGELRKSINARRASHSSDDRSNKGGW